MDFARLVMVGIVSSALAATAGCVATTEDGEQEPAAAESELKLSGIKFLGATASGSTNSVQYTGKPKHLAFSITAKGGDEITADVKSANGDSIGWITDSTYTVLATNDDASPSTFDAQVKYVVPAGKPPRAYRIVFREYKYASAKFDVKGTVKSPPVTCTYNGKTYQVGTTFNANDTCNTCTCSTNGQAACTKKACTCNPAAEPKRTYVGTPEQCMVIRYTCQASQVPFANGCGCGCETP